MGVTAPEVRILLSSLNFAQVMELVDIAALEAAAAMHEGSSPSLGTREFSLAKLVNAVV